MFGAWYKVYCVHCWSLNSEKSKLASACGVILPRKSLKPIKHMTSIQETGKHRTYPSKTALTYMSLTAHRVLGETAGHLYPGPCSEEERLSVTHRQMCSTCLWLRCQPECWRPLSCSPSGSFLLAPGNIHYCCGRSKTMKTSFLLCCPGEPARIWGRGWETEEKVLQHSRPHTKHIVAVWATTGGISSVLCPENYYSNNNKPFTSLILVTKLTKIPN